MLLDKHPNKPNNIKRLINKATVAMLQETHLSVNSGLKPLNAIFPADIYELDYSHGSGLAVGLCTATPLEASSQLCHESHLFLSKFPNCFDANVVIMGDFNMSPSPISCNFETL